MVSPEPSPERPAPTSFLPPTTGADPDRDVFLASYAARGKDKLKLAAGERVTNVFHPPPIFAIGIVLMVMFFIGGVIARATGFPAPAVVIVTGVFVAVGIFVVVRRRHVPRAPKTCTLEPAKAINPAFRVRLFASRNEAHAIGTLDDAAFEPVVTPIYFALRGRAWITVVVWFIASAATCVIWSLVRRKIGVLSMGASSPWEWWACFGIAAAPLMFLWPTYLRVSPGRLDVFQYGPLGSGTPKVTTFDLRNARVSVELPARFIAIETPEGTRRVIAFGTWVPRYLELTRMILQAARWRHDMPTLSNDALSS